MSSFSNPWPELAIQQRTRGDFNRRGGSAISLVQTLRRYNGTDSAHSRQNQYATVPGAAAGAWEAMELDSTRRDNDTNMRLNYRLNLIRFSDFLSKLGVSHE
jgi:hypothetical protein